MSERTAIDPEYVAELERRLQGRGQNTAESMARRLSEARLEMSKAPDYQFIVINDDFDTALEDILTILRAVRLRSSTQIGVNEKVQAILSDT